MEIISPEQRKNKHCYFCGTGESVKYVVEVNDILSRFIVVISACCLTTKREQQSNAE